MTVLTKKKKNKNNSFRALRRHCVRRELLYWTVLDCTCVPNKEFIEKKRMLQFRYKNAKEKKKNP